MISSSTRLFRALLLGAGLAVAGIPVAAAEVYQIDSSVWGHYQRYLAKIGTTRPGAFAITTDGRESFSVTCPDTNCIASGPSYSTEVKQYCEKESGTDCVVFAVRDEIKVAYEVRAGGLDYDSSNTGGANLAPAPTTRIVVSAEVQAKIDKYLRNASSGGKAWALAIAKDGSDVASAGCATTGGGGYFGGGGYCDLNKGTAQELASIEALKRCGGRDDCVLLYAGRQKVSSIELVTP